MRDSLSWVETGRPLAHYAPLGIPGESGGYMNVHKRWVATSIVVLFGALVSVGSTSVRPTVHSGSAAHTIAARSNAASQAIAVAAPATPIVFAAAEQPPDTSVVFAKSGRDTQINTRGFGDIGVQFSGQDRGQTHKKFGIYPAGALAGKNRRIRCDSWRESE